MMDIKDVTTNFYAPPSHVRGNWLELPEDEAYHAVRVLRKQAKDTITVVDGEGALHRVRLELVDKKHAAGTILETQRNVGEPPYPLTIGMALLKNQNRFEVFLEKAVELGVTEVIPLLTARTEKAHLKLNRAQNILVAAMKQSGRSRITRLADPQPLSQALADCNGSLRLFCHEKAETDQTLLRVLNAHNPNRPAAALIGPEGGFTEDEAETAEAAGAVVVSLGSRRPRGETAALTAAAGIMLARAAVS